MTQPKSNDNGAIRVADISIAQLSRGLYRSTATAFKELVSNAFDADARLVRIDTNYPEFDFISCVDDGTGMRLEEFRRYFKDQGIGSCMKRKHRRRRTALHKRPIIGRLGIGMLAIGQLCRSFEIESHYKEGGKGKAYHATIVLVDLEIPNVDEALENEDPGAKEIDVGTWEYNTIEYDERKQGFRAYSSDVRMTFTSEMRRSVNSRDEKKMSFDLSRLRQAFYDKLRKSVRDCGAYLECIWELANLCPLPYCDPKDKHPVDLSAFDPSGAGGGEFKSASKLIRARQTRLSRYDFGVVFDGVALRRFVKLPTEPKTLPKLYFLDFDQHVFERRLKFSGYLFAQVPGAIRPPELNGVQVRLKSVGIGGHDSTFLRYTKQIDTIRSRWVSGEIFVDEGLESALNIDRDSFNEHDEHFKKLQYTLHAKLGDVFEQIDRMARERSEGRRERKERQVTDALKAIISQRSAGKLRLRRRNLGPDECIVVVDEEKGQIILNTGARPLRKKKGDRLLAAVMLAYHASQQTAETDADRADAFYEAVRDVLAELT